VRPATGDDDGRVSGQVAPATTWLRTSSARRSETCETACVPSRCAQHRDARYWRRLNQECASERIARVLCDGRGRTGSPRRSAHTVARRLLRLRLAVAAATPAAASSAGSARAHGGRRSTQPRLPTTGIRCGGGIRAARRRRRSNRRRRGATRTCRSAARGAGPSTF
jgi:hypothetical protein